LFVFLRTAANALVARLSREGRLDEALLVMSDAAKLGVFPAQSTVNNLLRGAAKGGHFAELETMIDRMRNPTDEGGLLFSANGSRNVAGKKGIGEPDEQSHRMVLIGLAYAPSHVRVTVAEVAKHLRAAEQCAARKAANDLRNSTALPPPPPSDFQKPLAVSASFQKPLAESDASTFDGDFDDPPLQEDEEEEEGGEENENGEMRFGKPMAKTDGLCDARTYAAAVLAYLRVGDDVNNAARVIITRLLANGLPVSFAVWERLIGAFDSMFRRKTEVRFGENSNWEAREGAMMKVWRWMQHAHFRQTLAEADYSPYVASRWRGVASLLVLSLKNPDNVQTVGEKVLRWKCFSSLPPEEHAERDAMTAHLANVLLRDRRWADACALFANDLPNNAALLLPLFHRHATIAYRSGQLDFANVFREFAAKHKLPLPPAFKRPPPAPKVVELKS
jgi:hypothetical protein